MFALRRRARSVPVAFSAAKAWLLRRASRRGIAAYNSPAMSLAITYGRVRVATAR